MTYRIGTFIWQPDLTDQQVYKYKATRAFAKAHHPKMDFTKKSRPGYNLGKLRRCTANAGNLSASAGNKSIIAHHEMIIVSNRATITGNAPLIAVNETNIANYVNTIANNGSPVAGNRAVIVSKKATIANNQFFNLLETIYL